MAVLRLVAVVAVICVAAIVGVIALGWRFAIAPIAHPDGKFFAQDQIKRGAQLAALGDCGTCHTAPGGRPYAGGLGIATPFGTIYATNITPDQDTGIGRWSEAAFRRALRRGVSRDGRQLYPAFPYDHFTLLTDDDIAALYAFFMTRDAVRATAPGNDLRFPFNIRLLLGGWKLLFLREGPYQADAGHDARWNLGAYLVEGIAHCGACHTPRNVLGAEKGDNKFGGSEIDSWTAYALNQASPAPIPWDRDSLAFYLRHGWATDHGAAAGPMVPVIDNLSSLPDPVVDAMADYVASWRGTITPEQRRAAEQVRARVGRRHALNSEAEVLADEHNRGATIYKAACAPCHDSGRPLPYGGIKLALSSGPSGPDARNVANIVLWGLPATPGERRPIMPGFANTLSDQQLVDLLDYVRSDPGDKPPWSDVEGDIGAARNARPPDAAPPEPSANSPDASKQHEAQR